MLCVLGEFLSWWSKLTTGKRFWNRKKVKADQFKDDVDWCWVLQQLSATFFFYVQTGRGVGYHDADISDRSVHRIREIRTSSFPKPGNPSLPRRMYDFFSQNQYIVIQGLARMFKWSTDGLNVLILGKRRKRGARMPYWKQWETALFWCHVLRGFLCT